MFLSIAALADDGRYEDNVGWTDACGDDKSLQIRQGGKKGEDQGATELVPTNQPASTTGPSKHVMVRR